MADPVVDPADLAAVLGVGSLDDDRAAALIELAQSLCESIVSPLPDAARAVVLSVAARAYQNPVNAQSQTAGPYNVSYGPAASGGLYLSRQDRATLRRLSGRGTAFTIDPTPVDAGVGVPWWDWRNDTYLPTP